MSWTGPLEKRTWLDVPAVSPKSQEAPTVNPKMARAFELLKVYKRSKVAKILGVSKSTVTRWCKEK